MNRNMCIKAEFRVLDAGDIAFRRLHIPAYGVQGSKPAVIGIGVFKATLAIELAGVGGATLAVYPVKLFRRGEVKYCFHASINTPSAKKVNLRGGNENRDGH